MLSIITNTYFLLFVLFAISSDLAYCTENDLNKNLSIGLGIGINFNRDLTSRYFKQIAPEITGSYYLNLSSDYKVKLSTQLSSAWENPSMPQALSITEKDYLLITSAGISYGINIVPNFNLGTGVLARTKSLNISYPVVKKVDKISGTNYYFIGVAQFGVGIKLDPGGNFFLEPWAKYSYLPSDIRTKFALGTEFSYLF